MPSIVPCQKAQEAAEDDLQAVGDGHVPYQRGAGDGGPDQVAEYPDDTTQRRLGGSPVRVGRT
jgi:hypothetical protein